LRSGEGPDQGIMEVVEYPAPRLQLAVSSVVLLISLILLVRVFIRGSTLQGGASLLVSFAFTLIFLCAPQLREFTEVVRAVGEGRAYVKRVSGQRVPRVWLEALFLLSVVVGPFALSAFLPPDTWFSVVLGVTTGFSVSQIGFILYVRRWEKMNEVKLEKYRVTLDRDKGRLVVERGVRARR
jgi:hypothetical protein